MKRISLKKIIIMIIIILSVMGYNYYVVNKYVNAINVMHQKLLSMASSYYTDFMIQVVIHVLRESC